MGPVIKDQRNPFIHRRLGVPELQGKGLASSGPAVGKRKTPLKQLRQRGGGEKDAFDPAGLLFSDIKQDNPHFLGFFLLKWA